MITTIKTTVTFILPDEYTKAMGFREENMDWSCLETTQCIVFTNEQIYSVKTKGGDTE